MPPDSVFMPRTKLHCMNTSTSSAACVGITLAQPAKQVAWASGLRHHGQDVELPCRAGFSSDTTASYYFSYATAFNPSAEGLVLAANNQATPPEKNEIFEIGSKCLLMGGVLSLQGALFQIEKTSARTDDPILGVQVLDGKQRSRGVEFSAAG